MQGYKTDFPLLMQDKTVYIDNAATAQRPKCVIDAEKDFYTCHNANPLRGIYELSVQATEDYENARKAVRDFIGAKSVQEIIFTRNTTESIQLWAFQFEKGRRGGGFHNGTPQRPFAVANGLQADGCGA